MASVTSLDHDMRKLRMDRYTPQAAREVKSWIEETLREPLPSSDLLEGLKDGVALCKLANQVLAPPGIRFKQSSMPFTQRENISQFLTACENSPLNMPSHDRFLTVDLYDAKDPTQVLQCLGAFSRAANSLNPSKFPTTIGPKRASSPTKQSFGSQTPKSSPAALKPVPGHKPASGDSGYISSAMSTGTSRARTPADRSESPSAISSDGTGGLSGWTKKQDEANTAPAWNPNLYGYMGGASQGNQGISFGARRQITSASPGVSSYEEKMRRRREQEAAEEAEREQREAEERRQREEQEAEEKKQAEEQAEQERRRVQEREAQEQRAQMEEQRRWLEETKKAQERERQELEAQKAKWEDEDRRRREESDRVKRLEQEQEQRKQDEENEKARLAEQAKIERLEAEKRRVEEETERLRLQEEEHRAEETRKAQEAKKAEMEAQKRRWEEEEKRWKEEEAQRRNGEEQRKREEEDRAARDRQHLDEQQHRDAAPSRPDTILRGQSLSQYHSEQRKGSLQSQASDQSDRVRELERQLEEAKERERQYRLGREKRESRVASPEPSQTQSPMKRYDMEQSPQEDLEQRYLRQERSSHQERAISPAHTGGPRPPPSSARAPSSVTSSTRSSRPVESPHTEAQAAPIEPPSIVYSSSRYSEPAAPSSNRTDRYLASNPAPATTQPKIHYAAEMGMTSEVERAGEDARRTASQTKTKEGGWGSKSILQQEMERERERQREWEEQQMAKAKAQGLPVSPKPASVAKRGLIGPRSMAK